MSQPDGLPPSYDAAVGPAGKKSNKLNVPGAGIPPPARRSMEDESRPLPPGWIRQFDQNEHHQYFVDTNANPPRSIWHHPYDDMDYLRTLSSEERERLQEAQRPKTADNLIYDDTDPEDDHHDEKGSTEYKGMPLPLRPGATSRHSTAGSTGEKKGLGQKMKDKLTGSTHEERELKRQQRAEEEQRQYEAHAAMRRAMSKAMETGVPQAVGRDKEGHTVYVEPPGGGGGMGGMGQGYGAHQDSRSYNPYVHGGGPYDDPNARFIRPPMPYQGRPYGGGYGGYG